MEKSKQKTVLVVDDDPILREFFRTTLESSGYRVKEASDGEEAVQRMKRNGVDIVLVDLKLPGMDGIQTVETLNQFSDVPKILITGYASLESAIEAMKRGASDYLIKPVSSTYLKLSIERALERYELKQKNQMLLADNQRLREICDFGYQLYSQNDLESVLSILVEKTIKFLNVEGVTLYEVEPETGEIFSLVAYNKALGRELGEIRLKPGQGIAGRVIKTGKPYVTHDAVSDPRVDNSYDKKFGYTTRSLLAIPLEFSKGEKVGVLEAVNKVEGFFTDADREILMLLCYYVAPALEKLSLVFTDDLTGLFNRRHFKRQLELEINIRKRYGKSEVSLIGCDIDYFKHYNDTNGHPAGDEALRQVAVLIRKNIRGVDIPTRVGGEEFSIILPYTGKKEAMIVAERICRSIASYPFKYRENQPGGAFTVSLGVATYPTDASTSSDLVLKADQALYQAKALGRNRVCAWTKELEKVGAPSEKSVESGKGDE